MKVNLTGIEAASVQNNESTLKFVKKGLQPLTIVEVNETTSAGGTEGVEVTFQDTEDATFKHTFWTSINALPRLVYLIEKFTDKAVPTGDLGIEVLQALLVGKTKNVVVDAVLRNSKDGKYTNEWVTLRFAGFVEPTGKNAEPRVKDETTNVVNTTDSILSDLPKDADSDLPF